MCLSLSLSLSLSRSLSIFHCPPPHFIFLSVSLSPGAYNLPLISPAHAPQVVEKVVPVEVERLVEVSMCVCVCAYSRF